MNVNIIRLTVKIVLVILWKEFQWSESLIVEKCPLTNITWMKRSYEVGCEEKESSFYHCYRNSEGKLEEKCAGFFIANASGGCPYFTQKGDFDYTKCTGAGCSKESDLPYFSNEMYKYPSCLKQTSVVPKSVVTSVKINTSEETTQVIYQKVSTLLVIGESSSKNSQFMFSLPSAIILFIGSFIILYILIVKFQITEKLNNSHAQLIQDIESVREAMQRLSIQLKHETKRYQDGDNRLYESIQRDTRNEDPYDELRNHTENNVEAVHRYEAVP